jgi:hypothetical protein
MDDTVIFSEQKTIEELKLALDQKSGQVDTLARQLYQTNEDLKSVRGRLATTMRDARKIFKSRYEKILAKGAKHREDLMRQVGAAVHEREAAQTLLAATLKDVETRLPDINEMNAHMAEPKEGCECLVCKMHIRLVDQRRSYDELKEKYKITKETLKGFQGPQSKKKK